MPIWSAERTVDEPLVRRLIGGQFPEVPLRMVRPFAEGWDNAVWLVDETWVFRFPRREVALPLLEREIAVLPLLEPLLELPIPVPTHVCRSTDEFPWPFTGSRLITGREVAEASLTDAHRARLARPMAAFLRSLHASRVLDAVGAMLPADSIRRSDMSVSLPRGLGYLEEAERLGIWRTPASVRSLLAGAAGLPTPEPTVVVHSDLHARHVLVGRRRRAGGRDRLGRHVPRRLGRRPVDGVRDAQRGCARRLPGRARPRARRPTAPGGRRRHPSVRRAGVVRAPGGDGGDGARGARGLDRAADD